MLPTSARAFSLRLLVLAGPLATLASSQVDYELSLDRTTKLWTVEGRLANPGKEDVDYWFPRWTAGAYHQADFGRWVEELDARDAQGKALPAERVDDAHFHIAAAGSDPVIVRYTARSMSASTVPNDFSRFVIDVEANRIAKEDYAYVNPASLFGFVPATIDAPVSLKVALPEGWKAETVLPRDAQGVFHAPSYYRFEDSPFLFSPSLHTVELEAAKKPLAVTVYGADEAQTKKVAEGCKRIVESAAQLMGGLPYDRYEFLLGYVPSGSGSGLEHSFSTLVLMPQGIPAEAQWGILAHEYFHLWCAERIHVAAIHRPDYTQTLKTGTIWVNEGITEYFTQHVLLHAGLLDRRGFLQHFLEEHPVEANNAGSFPSLTQVSRDWEKIEGMNGLVNFIVQMYSEGPKTVFALDLAMRQASGGKQGILQLLRYLKSEYADHDRGFGEDEMPAILSKVAGADMSDFYKRYIDGAERPDLGALLDVIGYKIDAAQVVEVESPTPAQKAAREALFSAGDA